MHTANGATSAAQRFRDAVWEAGPDQLSTTELAVLLCYADHARGGDTAWVAHSRLIQRCKLRSKGTPSRVLADLVAKGWLELLSPAQWRNKQSPIYRLLIPTAPMIGVVEESRTTPIIGAVYESEPPRSLAEPPRFFAEPPRSVPQTAPMIGANRPDDRTPLSLEDPLDPLKRGSAPASPGDARSQEQPGVTLTAEEARAQIRERLAAKGRAPLSRWAGAGDVPEPSPDKAQHALEALEAALTKLPSPGEHDDGGSDDGGRAS